MDDQLELFDSSSCGGGELSQGGATGLVSTPSPHPHWEKPQVKKLAGEHLVMLEQHMAGWTNKEIAEFLGCTPQTVSNIITSDLGKEWIAERRSGMDEEFFGLYRKVISAVDDGLVAEDLAIRLTAADKWLKAHGRYAPKGHQTAAVTAEDIVQRLLEKGEINIHDSNVVIKNGD